MATAQKCLPFSAYRSSSVGGWDGIAPRTGPRRHLAFYHRSTNLPHSPTYRRAERAVLSASVKTRKRGKTDSKIGVDRPQARRSCWDDSGAGARVLRLLI